MTMKTSQIAVEIERYDLTVLRIREIQWIEAEKQEVDSGKLLLYFGHKENAPHAQGVLLMPSKEARKGLIG